MDDFRNGTDIWFDKKIENSFPLKIIFYQVLLLRNFTRVLKERFKDFSWKVTVSWQWRLCSELQVDYSAESSEALPEDILSTSK